MRTSIATLCVWVIIGVARAGAGDVPPWPFEHTPLPYQGYGMVVLLNDGTLLIKTGGETVQGTDLTEPVLDAVMYTLDPARLAVTEQEAGIKRLTVRTPSLSPAAKTLRQPRNDEQPAAERPVPFRRLTAERLSGLTPFSVLEYWGDMTLELDIQTGRPHIQITDRQTGESLVVPADLLVSAKRPSRNERLGNAESQTFGSTAGGTAPAPGTTKCEANCRRGQCSITCQGQAARCWCDRTGIPHCECYIPAD